MDRQLHKRLTTIATARLKAALQPYIPCYMPSTKVTLRQLLGLSQGRFIVPPYQRRYVWGQPRPGGAKDSASFLTECIERMLAKDEQLFINGITVCPAKDDESFEIVDGQQRLTYLRLLIEHFACHGIEVPPFHLRYSMRPDAERWMEEADALQPHGEPQTQDTFYFKHTLGCISAAWPAPTQELADAILDNLTLMCIELEDPDYAIPSFKMMNGTKTQMAAADIIKADLMRKAASDYSIEWEDWARWWNRSDVREYYSDCISADEPPLSLLLKLCLRHEHADMSLPLGFEEFRKAMHADGTDKTRNARRFFMLMRHAQMRFEDAYEIPERYNWIKAILLLQPQEERYLMLHHYFIQADIDEEELNKCYKYSFLGMNFSEMRAGMSPTPKFDEFLAAISMSDVYHSEAKRDAYHLLLRLNIDEDVKLGRKFDFSIWNNRSLEHIYSKSKVWHISEDGRLLDGNDNILHVSPQKIKNDPSYLHRDSIVNLDGVLLTEHCIGNLVLLYGQNNAAFGNTSFDEKKVMFLTPADIGAFKSRNLLHSVCVFAGKDWTAQSIIDNYNLIIKNLKQYYGYK